MQVLIEVPHMIRHMKLQEDQADWLLPHPHRDDNLHHKKNRPSRGESRFYLLLSNLRYQKNYDLEHLPVAIM